MSRTLLVATHNRGKVKEIARMLDGLDIQFKTLADLDIEFDVDETAPDFMGNAILKAEQYAKMSGYLTLADDSGLEVDALGGKPGVHTKRYGGAELDDEGRYLYLLENLAATAEPERGARFRCVMVLANGEGEILGSAEGVCEGKIAGEPAGSNGFRNGKFRCTGPGRNPLATAKARIAIVCTLRRATSGAPASGNAMSALQST